VSLTVSHAVPAESRKVTVAFRFISERTVQRTPQGTRKESCRCICYDTCLRKILICCSVTRKQTLGQRRDQFNFQLKVLYDGTDNRNIKTEQELSEEG
jgi:hypothetical protein